MTTRTRRYLTPRQYPPGVPARAEKVVDFFQWHDPMHPISLPRWELEGRAVLGCTGNAKVGDRVRGGGRIWSIEECPDFPWGGPRIVVQWPDGRRYHRPSELQLGEN